MKIIIIVNCTRSLVLFRGKLIERFVQLGHTVIAYSPERDMETEATLSSIGAEFHQLPFNRTGTNVVNDFLLLLRIRKILSLEKPDIVLLYTIKPVMYGSIAAKLAGVPRIYSIITGAGYVFIGTGIMKNSLRLIVSLLYKVALSANKKIIFLNGDDKKLFIERGLINQRSKYYQIYGEGIDITDYQHKQIEKNVVIKSSGIGLKKYSNSSVDRIIIFLLIARLLKDKGIREYAEAARITKEKYPFAYFWLVGPYDSNPAAISLNQVEQWVKDGVIIYHGETRDVRPYIEASSVYVLPSYREGLPRTVLEAMAMGKPIITTNAPGCCETVQEGINGFLVPVKDAQAIARAMEQFILHSEIIAKMGKSSRSIVEERFDVHKVNDHILRIMELI